MHRAVAEARFQAFITEVGRQIGVPRTGTRDTFAALAPDLDARVRDALLGSAAGNPLAQVTRLATPRLALAYEPSRDMMFFSSATRGFKSGGFNFSLSRALTAIESAQDDSPIGYEDGVLELSGGFGLLGFNPENLQLIAGVVESISGAGTAADPYQGALGAVGQSLLSNIVFRVSFLRQDGKTGHIDCLNARINASGGIQVKVQEPKCQASLEVTAKAAAS